MVHIKPQIFLVHFAGGNRYSFDFLIPKLNNFRPIALELPGRGRRIKERLLHDLDEASEDLTQQILSKLDVPNFVIYGHSLGAHLALLVSRKLENIGKKPKCIIVSGSAGLDIENRIQIHNANRSEFIDRIIELGGTPIEVVENEELFNFFEPILRADFQMAEQIKENNPKVNIPLFALMGNLEYNVDLIENWKNYTNGDFVYRIFSGNHFFIYSHEAEITEIIQKFYDKFSHMQ